MDNTIIYIPNISREYTFIHITDAHIAVAPDTATDEEKAMAEARTKFWTPGSGILPIDSFKAHLENAEELKADGIFLTGDGIDYQSDYNIEIMNKLCGESKVKVTYVYGNHEGGIDNKEFYPKYKRLMGDTPGFQVVDYGSFLVIAVDDSNKVISSAQLEAMETQMNRMLPIVLLLHIPLKTDAIAPSVMERWGTDFMIGTEDDPETTHTFCKMVKSEDSPVVAIFAGHVHYEHEGEFAPGKMQYTAAPAFTGYKRIIKIKPK